MNRWAWLLLAPYIVTTVKLEGTRNAYRVGRSTGSAIEVYDKTMAEDLAEALNQAHETIRDREKKRISVVDDEIQFKDIPIPCNSDNCGKPAQWK